MTDARVATVTKEHNAQCVHREGDDIYNGDADAEEPDEGDKKRKKKVLY